MAHRIIEDIITKPMKSAYTLGTFDDAKEALEKNGYKIISLEQTAQLRIKEGVNARVSQCGNWTKDGFIFVPKKGIFLTKNFPIRSIWDKKTNGDGDGNCFYLDSEQAENAISNSCKLSSLENHYTTHIPTSKFAEEGLTAYAFGSQAKEYGQLLKEAGIESLDIYTWNPDRHIIRQHPSVVRASIRAIYTWGSKSKRLFNSSQLDGTWTDWRNIVCSYIRTRGVKEK